MKDGSIRKTGRAARPRERGSGGVILCPFSTGGRSDDL